MVRISFASVLGGQLFARRPRRAGLAVEVVAARRARSALAGSSDSSCGARRPSKAALRMDCFSRATHTAQSATIRPGTQVNSRRLAVTSVAPLLRASAAMR